MSDMSPTGTICPRCREWVRNPGAHLCSNIPIPSLNRGSHVVAACLWQVNTLTDSASVTLTGLSGMDWVARIKMLQAAVGAADAEMTRRVGSSAALKIFVAPEFYFSTVDGHFFDERTKEQIRAALISLSGEFKDVLIIPGSVAWYKTSVRPGERAERKAQKHHGQVQQRDFRKYLSLYQQRLQPSLQPPVTEDAGYAQQDLARHWEDQVRHFGERLTETEHTLKVAHNTIFVLYGGGIWHKYNKRHEAVSEGQSLDVPGHADRANIVFPPTDSNPNVSPINGIRVGLETCVDHEHASLLTHSGTSNHLHVVASGTVWLMRGHAAVLPGGFVLQADAETAGAYLQDDLFPAEFDPYQEDENNPARAPKQPDVEIKAPQGKLYLSLLTVKLT